MSGGSENPKLTDQQQVDLQVGVINATSAVSDMAGSVFGHAGQPVFGTTHFDQHRLNALIDLVHSSNPADLENAGEALGKASKAISDAATELQRHLTYAGEDWKGQAGTAFQEWGDSLVAHTHSLADYADKAKVQIAAAATGLASVRGAMPPKDTRPLSDQKKPTDLPEAKQVEGNKEYAEAVRVEKNRQEAINQVNRLASFYSVSGGELAKLQAPEFKSMTQAGVPGPAYSRTASEASGGTPSGGTPSLAPHVSPKKVAASSPTHLDVSDGGGGGALSPAGHPAADTPTTPHHPTVPAAPTAPAAPAVGTEINNVDTLPSDTAKPAPMTPVSTPNGPTGPSATGTLPPAGTGVVPPPFAGPVGRAVGLGGATGGRAPVVARGQVPTAEGAPVRSVGGRGATGPVGRASAIGPQGARGPASATGRTPVGRGVTGGVPKAAGTSSPRTGKAPIGREGGVTGQPQGRTGPGATGAARTGGVVGGKPTAETGRNANGARLPRGTVIGGEEPAGARAAGERPGRRGVVGTPPARAGGKDDESGSRSTGLGRGSVGAGGSDEAADRGARRQKRARSDKKRSRDDARRGDTPSVTD